MFTISLTISRRTIIIKIDPNLVHVRGSMEEFEERRGMLPLLATIHFATFCETVCTAIVGVIQSEAPIHPTLQLIGSRQRFLQTLAQKVA